MRRFRSAYAVGVLAALAAACAQVSETTSQTPAARQAPIDFPGDDYERAALQGELVYRIDSARSLLTITVRRGGSMARLGHDHVVASHSVQGYAAPEAGRADLYVPLGEMTVDEPALRAKAKLDSQPSESDVSGTRSNMLNKVLEVQKFPFVLIRVNGFERSLTGTRLKVAITLHGVTRTLEMPADINIEQDEMTATGALEIAQSDFAIVPFSILGGAIQVQDRLSVTIGLEAHRGVKLFLP